MKNKRLIIILCIFAFLTVLVVLGSTVFTVSQISIKWNTTTNVLNPENNKDYINSAGIHLGESIFFVNKTEYKNRLEEKNPYIKINNIETKFPNQLIIHASEREQLYALKLKDKTNASNTVYAILDYELKVLELTTTPIISSNVTPAVLEIKNQSFTDADFTVGKIANNLLVKDILTGVGQGFLEAGYLNTHIKALVKNIVVDDGYINDVLILTNYGDLKISIQNADELLTQKIDAGLKVYEKLHADSINTGTIEVRKMASGEIVSIYKPTE